MEKKMERDEIDGGADPLRSRRALWEARIMDFRANPILGSGFASMDMSNSTQKANRQTGTVEPGNGWLFILSSTGLLGFLSLVIPMLMSLIGLYRKNGGAIIQRAYVFAAIVFFSVHTMAEGYIISSGSILFMLFWTHLFWGWHLSQSKSEQPLFDLK